MWCVDIHLFWNTLFDVVFALQVRRVSRFEVRTISAPLPLPDLQVQPIVNAPAAVPVALIPSAAPVIPVAAPAVSVAPAPYPVVVPVAASVSSVPSDSTTTMAATVNQTRSTKLRFSPFDSARRNTYPQLFLIIDFYVFTKLLYTQLPTTQKLYKLVHLTFTLRFSLSIKASQMKLSTYILHIVNYNCSSNSIHI